MSRLRIVKKNTPIVISDDEEPLLQYTPDDITEGLITCNWCLLPGHEAYCCPGLMPPSDILPTIQVHAGYELTNIRSIALKAIYPDDTTLCDRKVDFKTYRIDNDGTGTNHDKHDIFKILQTQLQCEVFATIMRNYPGSTDTGNIYRNIRGYLSVELLEGQTIRPRNWKLPPTPRYIPLHLLTARDISMCYPPKASNYFINVEYFVYNTAVVYLFTQF